MTRQQVKLKAKEDIRGRVFACFIPFLILGGIQLLIGYLLGENTYAIVPILVNIAMFPLSVGIAAIFLQVVRQKNSDIKMGKVFDFYKKTNRLGQIFLAYIVSSLYVIGGLILFIIPGIILAMRYSMLTFVLADYDDISWRDALYKCKQITDGRKGEIFIYMLSFFGWGILVAITLGILSIYVLPYYQATFANLYTIYNPTINVIDQEFLP
ncbi:MAG: DUF975 family protein [Clostridiales bacterium]|nr:DUF975 family protein [Clostridiales bacterium]